MCVGALKSLSPKLATVSRLSKNKGLYALRFPRALGRGSERIIVVCAKRATRFVIAVVGGGTEEFAAGPRKARFTVPQRVI